MLHSFKIIILAISVVKEGRQLPYFMKGFREYIFLFRESEIRRWLYLLFIKTFIAYLLYVMLLSEHQKVESQNLALVLRNQWKGQDSKVKSQHHMVSAMINKRRVLRELIGGGVLRTSSCRRESQAVFLKNEQDFTKQRGMERIFQVEEHDFWGEMDYQNLGIGREIYWEVKLGSC